MPAPTKSELADDHLRRVRRICGLLPGTAEKVSHGEPTFFTRKRVFVMFSNNHHGDGHLAVLIPAAPGVQEMLIHTSPAVYFRPKYVGVAGWVGIELAEIDDDMLAQHIREAWELIVDKATRGSKAKPRPTAGGLTAKRR